MNNSKTDLNDSSNECFSVKKKLPNKIKTILNNYANETVLVKEKLTRLMMHGDLSGTGNLIILPVDQGFEHGPDASFLTNAPAYDPAYHFDLAIEAGLSAIAAPLGFISSVADKYVGEIPTILKLNSANSLSNLKNPTQAITANCQAAFNLGCIGVGITIYWGAEDSYDMVEYTQAVIEEAKSLGMITVVWAYPRGGKLEKQDETSLDVCAYAAHNSFLLGAHVIKLKLPTNHISFLTEENAQGLRKLTGIKEYADADNSRDLLAPPNNYATNSEFFLEPAVKHIMRVTGDNSRLVVFSGSGKKDASLLRSEVQSIKNAGGNGSIIGRNVFQREKSEALSLLGELVRIYKSE